MISPTVLLILTAVAYLVTLLSKYAPLTKNLPKWAVPLVALATGWLGALVVGLTAGKPFGQAALEALSGIFAGAGATVIDQVQTQASPQAAVQRAVTAAVTAADAGAAPRRQELAAAVAISDAAARANALVRFANQHPPTP